MMGWAAGPGEDGPVVVVDIFSEHGLEVAPGVHKKMVQALFTYGPHPTFRERVGLR